MLSCYFYSDFPGAHKRWTLAITAVSRHDAREYLRLYHGGHGKPVGVMTSGEVTQAQVSHYNSPICGAVTAKAQEIISESWREFREGLRDFQEV